MKKNKSIIKKIALALVIGITLVIALTIPSAAEELVPGSESITETNLFEQIYAMAVANSDKIFSILAFLGTLVVGVGYKSGLLPLLRDALSRLKSSIDTVKDESDKNSLTQKERFAELSSSIEKIEETLEKNREELSRIEWQFESYEQLLNERRALKKVIEGQMYLLYSIFMSSSLPQYQKDMIGERIEELREELKAYETAEN